MSRPLGRLSVSSWLTAALACASALVFATGVSACGDGVLQPTEVTRSLQDAGYPNPHIEPDSLRSGGMRELVELSFGDADVTTVAIKAGGERRDVLVSALVYVHIDSGHGVLFDEREPSVTSFEGDELRIFQGANGTEPSVPPSFHLRRVRVVKICNAEVAALETTDDDDRFDRVVNYLRARC